MAPEQALGFAAAVPELRWVKVGLELFVAGGPDVVRQLRDQGKRVFLDLKFHDIPATMAGACRSAARLGAELITVHACAGSEALRAAQAAASESAAAAGLPQPTLLAVTVLTSWDPARFTAELAIEETVPDYVPRLAQLAHHIRPAGHEQLKAHLHPAQLQHRRRKTERLLWSHAIEGHDDPIGGRPVHAGSGSLTRPQATKPAGGFPSGSAA